MVDPASYRLAETILRDYDHDEHRNLVMSLALVIDATIAGWLLSAEREGLVAERKD